jgi:hypothetical protein
MNRKVTCRTKRTSTVQMDQRELIQLINTQELIQKNPGSVYVGFVVDKVALGQVFLRVVGFPLSI